MKKTKTQFFYTSDEFNSLWNGLKPLGSLSEGECKRLNNNMAIKLLNNINEDINCEEYFLKFRDLEMKTYIFAKKVFYVDNILRGYISKYFNGENLSFIDRNKINFDELKNACKEVYEDNHNLSRNGIQTYDVPFNIMYKRSHFGIVDTCEYTYTNKDSSILYKENCKTFNSAILEFLVKSTFYKFIKSSKELSKGYQEAKHEEDITLYIELLKNKLSEYLDFEVKYIRDAKKLISTSEDCLYPELLQDNDEPYKEIDNPKELLQKYNNSSIQIYY